MKHRLLLLTAVVLLTGLRTAHARINVFDLWYPGHDSTLGPVYSYEPVAGLITGERFFELPVHFTYVSGPRTEVGGRWGIRSVDGRTGISDLLLGLKYQFLNGSSRYPRVVGETAVSLPTADYTRGLGTGAGGLLLEWLLEQEIRDVTGYFGLGIRLNGENSDRVQEGNVFNYHLGAGYTYAPRWRFYGELKGFNHGRPKVNGELAGSAYQELYLAPGLNFFWSARNTLSAALLIGLTPESSDIGLFISSNF
jgi:hypothetical protein